MGPFPYVSGQEVPQGFLEPFLRKIEMVPLILLEDNGDVPGAEQLFRPAGTGLYGGETAVPGALLPIAQGEVHPPEPGREGAGFQEGEKPIKPEGPRQGGNAVEERLFCGGPQGEKTRHGYAGGIPQGRISHFPLRFRKDGFLQETEEARTVPAEGFARGETLCRPWGQVIVPVHTGEKDEGGAEFLGKKRCPFRYAVRAGDVDDRGGVFRCKDCKREGSFSEDALHLISL